MVRKEYSAGGVKHPFWFLEFKKAAILRDQGVTWEELRTRSREENLFSAASPARAEMTCNTVEARMQTLPDSFLPMFVFGDPATQKLFCLLGCMGNDTLFFDFCYEVIREKVQLGAKLFRMPTSAFSSRISSRRMKKWPSGRTTRSSALAAITKICCMKPGSPTTAKPSAATPSPSLTVNWNTG